MKVISLQQPFAYLLVAGFKPCETRDWATRKVKERRIKPEFKALLDTFPFNLFVEKNRLHTGALVGMVRFQGCMSADFYKQMCSGLGTTTNGVEFNPLIYHYATLLGDLSHSGRVAWVHSEQRMFVNPIPANGKLNIWEYESDLRQTNSDKVEYVQRRVQYINSLGNYNFQETMESLYP